MYAKIHLDMETAERLMEDAAAHYRPADDHLVVLLRKALKLPVPRVKRPVTTANDAVELVKHSE
jgi:hypothetical protein